MKKRVLPTLILVFCMVLALATTAFAEDSEQVAYQGSTSYASFSALAEAIDGLAYDSNTNTLSLTSNVTLSGAINLYADVTFDLSGYGLTSSGGGVYVWSGSVIITDSSNEGTGSITGNSNRAVQVSGSDASLTINGGTLSGSSFGAMAFSGSALTINGGTVAGTTYYGVYVDSATAVINKGTIQGGYTGMWVNTGATATVNGGTIQGVGASDEDSACGIIVWGPTESTSTDTTTLIVNDGTIISDNWFAITTQGTNYNVNITINGGTITSENASAMYLPAKNSTTTINGGTITGEDSAIEIRAGSLTVNGGTLTATSETAYYYENGSGTTVCGAAIAVSQHSTNQEITVTVNSGTLVGYYGVLEVNTYASKNRNNVTVEVGGDTVVTANGTWDTDLISGEEVRYDDNAGLYYWTETVGTATYTFYYLGVDGTAVYSASVSDDGETTGASEYTTVAVTGGTYNTDVTEYLDSSVTAVATYTSGDSTTYSYYTSESEALAASPAGAVVTSISDDEEDETTTTYIIRAATCTTTGVAKVVTTVDEGTTTKYVAIPATGHSYSYTWDWAEDYSSATVTAVCTVCQAEETAEAEVDSVTTTEATCTTDGEITYTATAEVDGETVTDTQTAPISAKGHMEATKYTGNCVQGTAKLVTYCTVCEEELGFTDVAQTSYHSYVYDADDVVWTPVTDENGTVTGYTLSVTAHCLYCTKTNTETSNVVATYVVTEEPTCTSEGKATVTANTAALHWYDEETGSASELKALTLTAEVNVAKLSATGEHTYVEQVVDATCTDPAYVTEVCSVCGQTNPDAETKEVEGSEPLGHNYDDGVVTTAATCTEDGVMTYTCSLCGDTYTETIVATGHTWDEGEYQDATCTEADSVLYTCTACNATYTEEIGLTKATGHSYEAVVTDPTCTEGGYTTYTCSVCNDSYVADETEAVADAHDYVLTNTLKEATCTTTGVGKYTCQYCGKTVYRVIEAEHDWTKVENSETAATCTEDGKVEYICTVCEETEWRTIAATGHSYDEGVVTTEATCAEDGVMTYTCSVCGDTYTETIDATGEHDYVETVIDATCTEPAKGGYFCSVCGAEDPDNPAEAVENSEPLGHSYDNGVVTTKATCTDAGEMTYTCSLCGDSYTEEIAATGHIWDEGKYQEATCTEADSVLYTCTVCGETYIDEIGLVDATGHTEGEAVTENVVAATCTEDGSYDTVVYCTECGKELSRETIAVAATGHSYEAVVTEPTCTTGGCTTYTCSACGDSYTDNETEAVADAHDYVLTSTLKAADCSTATNGVGKYTCQYCNATKYAVINYEHDWAVVESSEVAATCTEDGSVKYVCTECGAIEERTIVATGHTAGEAVTENELAATCVTAGSYDSVVYCSVCGEEISRETVTVPATGEHTYGEETVAEDGYTIIQVCTVCGDEKIVDYVEHDHEYETVVTEPTCTEAGYTTYTCSVCGDTYTANETEATGHTTEIQDAKDATCTEDGYTGDTVCTVCGETIETGETIPATGHTWDEGEVTTEATATEDGVMTYTCTVCGATYTEVIPATGETGCTHVAGEAVIENEVAATCTTDGSYDSVVYCETCGEELSRESVTVPATGHSYEAVVTEPTCTEGGYTTYTCSACGDSYVADETEATGHTYGEPVFTWNEDENGNVICTVTITCSDCGKEETVESEVTSEETEVTCTVDGAIEYTCTATIDGQEYTDTLTVVTDKATGHVWKLTYNEETCSWIKYCTVCGEETT